MALRASLAVDMFGVDGGAAKRRRERRLRAMQRHERQTVAMELAAALHHSRDARSEVAHVALRGQKTASSGARPAPLAEVAGPQGRAATVGYVAALVPTLAGHRLTSDDDGVDGRTVRFLLKQSLALKKKEEEEEERRRMVRESVERVRARVDAENAARHASSSSSVVKRRKRKKKRKRKAPRCALLRFPRARAVRTRKSEHIPASCLWQSLRCPRSTGVLDYFWEMSSWLRLCIWQSLVCLSCLWFAWLDSGYIFTSVYRKMFRIQRIVWFDIGYNILRQSTKLFGR